ncbi:hypothetical protein Mapa_013791 [Marchantia paleacea]|nr:hypothetical protein Mapa_013791 [Marchantia paleacea]
MKIIMGFYIHCIVVGFLLESASLNAKEVPICDTSEASPFSLDVQTCIDHLTELGRQTDCCLENCWASKCTTMAYAGTAAVSICYEGGNSCHNYCMPCSRAALLLNAVNKECTRYMENQILKAGGWLTHYDEDEDFSVSLLVYNSKDS